MSKKSKKIQICKIGGERIDTSVQKVTHTNIGCVCERCYPVYDVVRNKVVDDPKNWYINSKQIRKKIMEVLEDKDFVVSTIREMVKDAVFRIIEKTDEWWNWDSLANRLIEVFTRGIYENEYVKIEPDKKDHCGLSLQAAKGCIREGTRTFCFVKALLEKLDRLEGEKGEVELVDAGCGPIPLFGAIAALKSPNVKVTCLEVNPASALMAEQILKNIGLVDRVEVKVVDARKYEHSKEIDLLISETMYSGLMSEPMVQILENMSSQVAKDGEIIPKKVVVEAQVVDRSYRFLTEALERDFDGQDVFEYLPGSMNEEKIQFTLPLDPNVLENGDYAVALSSRVYLDDERLLEKGNSVITTPLVVGDSIVYERAEDAGKEVRVSYVPGCNDDEVEVSLV